MPGSSPRVGLTIFRMRLAGGLPIPIGGSSGQRWGALPTISAGIVSGNVMSASSPPDSRLRLTTSGLSVVVHSWLMPGLTGFSVAKGATAKTKKTNGRNQATLILAQSILRNARSSILIMMRTPGK